MAFSSLCVFTQAYADTVFPLTRVHHNVLVLKPGCTAESPRRSLKFYVHVPTPLQMMYTALCFIQSFCLSPCLNNKMCVLPQTPSRSCSPSPLKFQCLYANINTRKASSSFSICLVLISARLLSPHSKYLCTCPHPPKPCG